MSTLIATFDLPTESLRPALSDPPRHARAELRPWGFWASLGWGLLAMATALFALVVYTIVWMLMNQLRIPSASDAAFGTAAGVLASVAPMIVLVIAVKSRRYALRDYFALGNFPRRDLALGVVCLIALIAVFDAAERLLGIDGGSQSVVETYQAAKRAGELPMLWLATVIVAPVTEELLFRGFLHRGWAPSRLGICGTIVLTSALWAVLHQQYNWLGILCIFVMALMFGWLRQRSGSTTLTTLLHFLNNLIAMACVAVQVEWLA